MKPKTELNAEQFTWLMTLTKDEKEKILRLLQTGDWLLVWQEVPVPVQVPVQALAPVPARVPVQDQGDPPAP